MNRGHSLLGVPPTGSGYTRFAHRACSLDPKGSLIEHLGIYSLSVLILYEEPLTRKLLTTQARID